MEQQQAEQAGLLLWRCGEPVGALQAFASSSSWRNAICTAQQIPLPPDQLALLARDLAGNHDNRHRDADKSDRQGAGTLVGHSTTPAERRCSSILK